MNGFHIQKIFVIICEVCEENIVERADEGDITTVAEAEQYARGHRARHLDDGDWPYQVRT